MKIIKYLLFLILILIIAGSIYIATKEGEYQVEQSKNIEAPREMIFDEVNDFRNWQNWHPWSRKAEDVVVNFGEKTRGEGASYAWKSENSANGEIHTVETKPFASIKQELKLETSFSEATGNIYWRFEKQENETVVTWGIKGEQSFMDKLAYSLQNGSVTQMMRPKLEKGLEDLEQTILNKMEAYSINVDGITNHGGGYYMYTTTASKTSQIDDLMPNMIDKISRYMDNNSIEKIGHPFVLYNEWNEENNTAIFSAGIFTPSEIITPAESSVLNGEMPNQKVVKTTLKGDYKYLREAWEAARDYIEKNDLEEASDAKAFEVYMTQPDEVSNPANWITQLYIPVE